jgi:hypothetical protein
MMRLSTVGSISLELALQVDVKSYLVDAVVIIIAKHVYGNQARIRVDPAFMSASSCVAYK